jgi:hypothetical protein
MDNPTNRAVIAASPYSYRPPSPPIINIPAQQHHEDDKCGIKPSYDLVDSSQVSGEEFVIITGNRTQTPVDHASSWKYEQRREAQSILDFLYLGPTSVIRDHSFIQREAISMVVVVRDARAPRNLPSVNAASSTFGISFLYIDIDPNHLVRSFYTMVQNVNSHLITRNSSQESIAEDSPERFKQPRAKVLVTCDSGNDRSPPLVAAYIMFMYGRSMTAALQFISIQRFCCSFDEEWKQALLTWQEITKASTAVASHFQSHEAATVQLAHNKDKANAKRNLNDMLDVAEEDKDLVADYSIGDCERFDGRETFVPFMEIDD